MTAVLLAMGRDSADGTIELRRPGHRLRVRWDTPAERLAAAGRLPAEPEHDTPPRIRARATVGRVSGSRPAEGARA
jgi:hypothetical protein